MTNLFRKFIKLNIPNIKRSFHYTAIRNIIDREGKTDIKFLSKELAGGFIVNAFSDVGFTLSPGINIIGPVIVFPRTFLSWNIESSSDMNEDNLCLFNVIEPQLDILVIGLDQDYPKHAPFMKDLRVWLKKSNINYEILPVRHAVSTYNFLASEGRFVGAALVPPKDNIPRFISCKPLSEEESLPVY